MKYSTWLNLAHRMANEQKLRAYFVDGTFSEPSFIDVMSTPSVNKTDKAGSSFFRTPGQVMSLTSNFTFVSNYTIFACSLHQQPYREIFRKTLRVRSSEMIRIRVS